MGDVEKRKTKKEEAELGDQVSTVICCKKYEKVQTN